MKPLKGVRVLDLTRHLPGPFATKLLADMGAEVTKIELPQMPDPARTMPALFESLNAGKTQLSIDYSRAHGRSRLLELLKGARVLVEGFRPGLMARLELDYASLRRKFPKLVYCSITGYGQEGPYSRIAGHDLDYQAMSGMLSQTDGMPGAQFADLSGSFYAAFSIASALHQPKGAHLDVSMTAAARSVLHIPQGDAVARRRAARPGEGWWNGGDPFYAVYETKDGKRLAVAGFETAFAARLLELLELKDVEGLMGDRQKNAEAIRARLAAAFKTRSRDEWTRLLFDKEACVAPVLDVLEAAQDPAPPVTWK